MDKSKSEILVGVFLFFGLIVLGIIILTFGNFGHIFKKNYSVYVRFEDATGLIKGSDVKINGAKIGVIGDEPIYQRNDYSKGVLLRLDIYEDYKIPENSEFGVTQANIFSDKFINIMPSQKVEGYIKANTEHQGSSSDILSELPKKIDKVYVEFKEISKLTKVNLAKLEKIMTKMDEKILSKENSENVSNAIANIKDGAEKFNQTMQDIKPLLAKVEKTFGKVDATVDEIGVFAKDAGDTVKEIKPSLKKFSSATDDIKSSLGEFTAISKKVRKSLDSDKTVLGSLLKGGKLRSELEQFIENLRRTGIYRYKDLSNEKSRYERGIFYNGDKKR